MTNAVQQIDVMLFAQENAKRQVFNAIFRAVAIGRLCWLFGWCIVYNNDDDGDGVYDASDSVDVSIYRRDNVCLSMAPHER